MPKYILQKTSLYKPTDMKVCIKCKRLLNVGEFSIRHREKGDYFRSDCRNCCASHAREWRKNNPEKMALATKNWRMSHPEQVKLHDRKHAYQRSYGISLEQFEDMLKLQDSKCANEGCRITLTIGKKGDSAHLDHDHKTGKIRAILCANCNSSLGKLKENPYTIVGLAEYIRKHAV